MLDENMKKKLLGREDCFSDIVGQEEAKGNLKSALLTERHIIIIGAPGIGKTTLAKNVAKLTPEIIVNDCPYNCLPEKPVCPECKTGKKTKTKKLPGEKRFVRIQGSPDLTAEDLLGDIEPVKALKFGPMSIEAFTPGKIFKANNGILFFDEINRCPEKLQNALLQVLEEKKATLGSYDVDFEADFIFIGTMNPKDTSTEKLSDVFVDRFDLVYMNYPENSINESRIVRAKGKNLGIRFPENLFILMVSFVRGLRENKKLEKLPSVRATIGLYERAQANALLRGNKEVEFSDLRNAVDSVLAHRIELKPSFRYLISPENFVKEEFARFAESQPHSDESGGYL